MKLVTNCNAIERLNSVETALYVILRLRIILQYESYRDNRFQSPRVKNVYHVVTFNYRT